MVEPTRASAYIDWTLLTIHTWELHDEEYFQMCNNSWIQKSSAYLNDWSSWERIKWKLFFIYWFSINNKPRRWFDSSWNFLQLLFHAWKLRMTLEWFVWGTSMTVSSKSRMSLDLNNRREKFSAVFLSSCMLNSSYTAINPAGKSYYYRASLHTRKKHICLNMCDFYAFHL